MDTPVRITLWHLWRRTRAELFFVTVAQCALWTLVVLLMESVSKGTAVYVSPVFAFLAALACMVTELWVGGLDNPRSSTAFPLRAHFVQPVRTFPLVFITMLYSAVKAAVAYLFVAGYMRAALDMPFPLAPVAALVAVACVATEAAIWTPTNYAARALSYLGTGLAFIAACVWWLEYRTPFDDLFETPQALADAIRHTPMDYVFLLAVFAASVTVATVALDRQRHGESLWPRFRGSAMAARQSARVKPLRPFANSVRAQAWYEVRRAVLPALTVMPAFLLAQIPLLITLEVTDPAALDAKMVLWTLFPLGAVAVACVLATGWSTSLRNRAGVVRMSAFDAALPVSTGRLAFLKTAAIAAAGLGTALLMAAAFCIWAWFSVPPEVWANLREGASELPPLFEVLGIFGMLAIVLALLIPLLSVPSLILATGLWIVRFPRALVAIVLAGFGYMMLHIFSRAFDWDLGPFWRIHATALALGIIAGVAWAVFRAWRQGHASIRILGGVFSLGIFACLLSLLTLPELDVSLQGAGTVLVAALLLLPMAAVALPPLALDMHRHR